MGTYHTDHTGILPRSENADGAVRRAKTVPVWREQEEQDASENADPPGG